jgi:ParB family chromosome partitioning protein
VTLRETSTLADISPDRIRSNPENPRLIFREEEMRILRESIRSIGIQIPLTVYREGTHYVILDGERRWRCARKLNLAKVPVLVQPRPGKLENLLTMFNIHNVRVEWDVMPTAYKIGEVRDLLKEGKRAHDIATLASLTGLTKGMVRSCLELIELPEKYQKILMAEAHKPKHEQRITPDLFIELNKSLRVVQTYVPAVFDERGITPTTYRDALFEKYRDGKIKSVVTFRDISKIARAERAGGKSEDVVPIIKDLVKDSTYTVREAFEDSVKSAYAQRDLNSRAHALLERLSGVKSKEIARDTRMTLRQLRDRLNDLLGD